jgi:uncharacterized membrane protein
MVLTRQQRRSAGVVAVLVAAAAGIAVGLVLSAPQEQHQAAVVPHYPSVGSDVRTLDVAAAGTTEVSPAGGPLSASYLSGTMPAGPMMATVLSDANCAPDADGVSHCLNRLRLDGGTELTVRHNHRMTEVPCLAPGERVLVEPS